MSNAHARRRNLTLLSASVAAAGALAVPALAATPASAATVSGQAFITPGDYGIYVPPGTTQVIVAGLGGAGTAGFPGAHLAVPGGAGGAGTSVSATFNVSPASIVKAGDYLTIHVGDLGGGAPGGHSDTQQFLGPGGKGGGATFVYDGSNYLVVAAGGGGGGAGATDSFTPKGGYGGADGDGQQGLGIRGDGDFGTETLPAGRGGALGGDQNCDNGSYVDSGQVGETAAPGSYAGGGGGGGAGICGGQSGGSGDHGTGFGSGGGGGAGASATGPGALNVRRGANSANTGNGNVVITFVQAS
jgi:hypothetical protein